MLNRLSESLQALVPSRNDAFEVATLKAVVIAGVVSALSVVLGNEVKRLDPPQGGQKTTIVDSRH